jgi:hypothetical protein
MWMTILQKSTCYRLLLSGAVVYARISTFLNEYAIGDGEINRHPFVLLASGAQARPFPCELIAARWADIGNGFQLIELHRRGSS